MSHKSPLLRRILIQDQLPAQSFYGTNTKRTFNKRPFAKRLNTEYTNKATILNTRGSLKGSQIFIHAFMAYTCLNGKKNTPKWLGQLQVDTDDISKTLVESKIIKRVCRSYNIDRENEHLTGYAIYTHMNNPLGTTTIQILLVSCRKQISAKLRTADIFIFCTLHRIICIQCNNSNTNILVNIGYGLVERQHIDAMYNKECPKCQKDTYL